MAEKQRVKCDCCHKTFSDKYQLKLHTRIHTGEKPFKCSYCHKAFAQNNVLQMHLITHSDQKFYKCTTCRKLFVSSQQQNPKTQTMQCASCIQGKNPSVSEANFFNDLSTLGAGINISSESAFGYVSIQDKNPSSGEKHFSNDLRTIETGINQNTGRICSAMFETKKNFTDTGKKSIKCQTCHKAFRQAWYLRRHMMTHTGERPHKCNICQKGFTRNDRLKAHIKSYHTGGKPYKRNITDEEKAFKCRTCRKGFDREYGLRRHEMIHAVEKPHKCSMCEKAFSRNDKLVAHIRNCHTGEKAYQAHMQTNTRRNYFECQTCRKVFDQECDLKFHMMVHTVEKPHKCNTCQKSFAGSYTLQAHKKTHIGEKSYKCNICLKTFAQNEVLQQHLRIHEEERWYLCQKTFALSLQRHPNTKTMRCVSCFQGNKTCVGDKCIFIDLSQGADSDEITEMPYGCGICDELLETEKEFVKHCYQHYTDTPHKDTFLKILDIKHLSSYF